MKFQLENEDLVLISGGVIALIQTHFNIVDPMFTVSISMIFKGILSCFIPGTTK